MKMAGILLIYILGIYFLLTKMVQLEDEAVVGVKKTHKELSETTHSSNEKAIQYVASNMIKEAPKIAITFDDGPSPAWTPKLLDGLKERNVKATFFMTGGWVDSYPDMGKEICSRGHDLGNHSHNHKQMSKLSASEQKDEIMYVTDKVKELTGYDVFLFRPPYGDYNSTLINTVYGCNHYPIQWNVDSLDWRDYGVENIIKTVTNHKALGNGSIILMHNGAKYTAKALGTVIETLQSQGYTFIPIFTWMEPEDRLQINHAFSSRHSQLP